MNDSGYALGLVVHPRNDVSASVDVLVDWAQRHGTGLVAQEAAGDRVHDVRRVRDDDLVGLVDGIVALGGDGTMLGAMRMVVGSDVPVLGVNHGHLGFLVEVAPGDLTAALDRLPGGDFSLEAHDCLRVSLPDHEPSVAFNDVVLTREGVTGAADLELEIAGLRYGYYKADALVVSTAIGSTAYSYAAGGPVVSPGCEVMVVTPVAPMGGISRPVVFGSQDAVGLAVREDGAPVVVIADGVEVARLAPGAALRIETLRDAARVVRLDPTGHAQRSRVKLSLLDLPLRSDQLLDLVPEHLRRPHA